MPAKQVTRNALLIGSPGGVNTSLLKGVPSDLLAVKQFLRSDRGGSFRNDEIHVLGDPSWKDAVYISKHWQSDYTVTYFSGHGYTDVNTGRRMLCFKDGNIEDFRLVNLSPRQLIIADACRNLTSAAIGAIPQAQEGHYNFIGEDSILRRYFDDYIRMSPAGKLIVFGTMPGMYAVDSPLGGHFTRALLEASYSIEVDNGYSFHSVENLLDRVNANLYTVRHQQKASIAYKEGQLLVPFAAGMPKKSNAVKAAKPVVYKEQPVNWPVLMAIAGLFIIAAGID